MGNVLMRDGNKIEVLGKFIQLRSVYELWIEPFVLVLEYQQEVPLISANELVIEGDIDR